MPYTFEELHRGQREEVDFALPVTQDFGAWQAQRAEGRPFFGRGRVLGNSALKMVKDDELEKIEENGRIFLFS